MTGTLLLPLFILAILIIVGLTAWLVITLIGGDQKQESKRRQSGAKAQRSSSVTTSRILSVGRNSRGLWEVQVLGEPYQRLEDVPDAETRTEVVNAIRIVAAFGRNYIAKQGKTAPKRAETAAPNPTPIPPLPSKEARLHRPTKPPTLIPQINLAKEISEILETKQQQRSSLAKRSIRLQNAPGGGVWFVIDGHTYTAVDEIPDLEVQALIRDATREWEKR